jgi:tricorn protease
MRYLLASTYFILLTYLPVTSHSSEQTLLLRQPAMSKDHITFVYGGDIWLANRKGNNVRRLSSHPAIESHPKFSPDGQWIAFSANYDNNVDVYVIPVQGGQPKRLTWHPEDDIVNGWTPEGQHIVFTSAREILNSRSQQIYHISRKGGFPNKLMEGVVAQGTWSEDGKRFAYNPYVPAYQRSSGWRQHRGGSTPPIWIIDPGTQQVEKIPHVRANDTNPMWIGNDVYFISDRNSGAANLFRYNTGNQQLSQLTHETVWDIRHADAYGKKIIYEVGGRLKELDVKQLNEKEIVVSIKADSPQLRAQWKDAEKTIQNIALSPTGKRALISARGEVFTVPIKEGSTRNLTNSAGVREKDATWSPKGDKIAYISDSEGKQRLTIINQSGMGESKSYPLGESAYFYLLSLTADAEHAIVEDNHLNLYAINLNSGKRVLVATDSRRDDPQPALSPDGKWLAYRHLGENYFGDIILYHFESGKHTKLTNGMVHTASPSFSKDGKYLYFMASTNAGPGRLEFNMSSQERPIRQGIYAVILEKAGKSPVFLESDEEPAYKQGNDKKNGDEDKPETPVVAIDINGIKQRIVALPIPERNYGRLSSADDGSLYYMEYMQPGVSQDLPGTDTEASSTLHRFDFETKESNVVKEKMSDYVLSFDGKHLLIKAEKEQLLQGEIKEKLDLKPVALDGLKTFIDPRKEWAHIFDETWRMERDFFYDEKMHGLDWKKIKQRYQALLPYVSTREDLNLLLVEMIAELQVGHNRISGGDTHREKTIQVGLLGADLRVENGYYRIKTIYSGDQWSPFLEAPLAEPDLDVSEGDYILAVNGVPIGPRENIYSRFEDTAGKQITLTINSRAQEKDARDIVVKPVKNDNLLRRWYWVEKNRQYVDKKTQGRVGYIYLPDTGDGGFKYFNRMFFAQADKEALIIDERRNDGGQAANYITNLLSQHYLAGWKDRDGLTMHTPTGAVYGPKVMLIDQDAGSGGDFLPYSFRSMKLGPLIGTTTWGGLIGISANPELIDGGDLVVPHFRFFTPEGQWAIENEGVSPDIEVQLETVDVNKGIDTQLERAIVEIQAQLKTYTPVIQKTAPVPPTLLN